MQKLVFAFVGMLVIYLALEYDLLGLDKSDQDPYANIVAGPVGYEATYAVAAADQNKILFAQEIFAGLPEQTEYGAFDRVDLVEQVENCRFTPPSVGMSLANIQVGSGGTDSSLYAYSEAVMAQDMLKWLQANNSNADATSISDAITLRPVPIINVAITNDTQILYLVLQSSETGVVWNIHKRPETRIAHISVISNGTSGVIGVDTNIPVQFLDISQNPECKIPGRNLRALPPYDAGPDVTQAEIDEEYTRRWQNFLAYSTWFLTQFGVPSETNLIGIGKTSHVLVGPIPEDEANLLQFNSVDGQTVRATGNDIVYISPTRDAAMEYALEVYSDLIARATGGDTQLLTPNALERSQ